MIDPNKPFKLTKKEIARRADIEPGMTIPFTEELRPVHDKMRKVYKLSCEICSFHFDHRLYVCPRCGTCQACGGLNEVGDINQSCHHCGNGAMVPDIIPPTITSDPTQHDEDHDLGHIKRADKRIAHNGDENDANNLHQQNSFV